MGCFVAEALYWNSSLDVVVLQALSQAQKRAYAAPQLKHFDHRGLRTKAMLRPQC